MEPLPVPLRWCTETSPAPMHITLKADDKFPPVSVDFRIGTNERCQPCNRDNASRSERNCFPCTFSGNSRRRRIVCEDQKPELANRCAARIPTGRSFREVAQLLRPSLPQFRCQVLDFKSRSLDADHLQGCRCWIRGGIFGFYYAAIRYKKVTSCCILPPSQTTRPTSTMPPKKMKPLASGGERRYNAPKDSLERFLLEHAWIGYWDENQGLAGSETSPWTSTFPGRISSYQSLKDTRSDFLRDADNVVGAEKKGHWKRKFKSKTIDEVTITSMTYRADSIVSNIPNMEGPRKLI